MFFKNNFFEKLFFRNNIRMSNSLDPDQDRHSLFPDLGTNCLQRISVKNWPLARKELKEHVPHRFRLKKMSIKV